MIFSAQTRKTLVVCIISAIICGLVPGELIFWVPGVIFGVLFSIINMRGGPRVAIYSIASGAIYFGAVQIFFRTMGPIDNHITINAGFLEGLFGAVLLAFVTKVLGSVSIKFVDEGLTALAGGLLGVLFIQIAFSNLNVFANDDASFIIHLILAFIVWQVPIGWLLTYNLQKRFHVPVTPSVDVLSEEQ